MPSKHVQKTLHKILDKLGKLDSTESSVYKLQATQLDLETRTKTLEEFHHKAGKDINDLIWFPYLSLTTLHLLTTELKLNDAKENSQRIIHKNMNTSNFTRSWLNLYHTLYWRANANATVFVFNWKVNIKEQRFLILFALIESYTQTFSVA